MWKTHGNKILSPVEPTDQVMLRLKLFDALIEISKFLFDYQEKNMRVKKPNYTT